MEQSQINEILKHQKELLSSIDRTIVEGLRDVNIPIGELKERILDGMRWGLFFRKNVKNVLAARTTVFPNDDIGISPLVRINFHEVSALQKQIKTFGFYKAPIFSQEIDEQYFNREIQVDFSHDTLQSTTVEIRSTFNRPDTTKLLKQFELKLTLPDAEDVFGIDDNSQLDNELLSKLEIYDVWKWSIEHDYDTYFQIGGNGRWVEKCHSKNYIAQVNNNVGDEGSVFIIVRPNGDFKSFIETY